MNLTYRGLTYDYDSAKAPCQPFQPVRRSGSAYTMIYRGVAYRVDPDAQPAETYSLPSAYQLIYRGMTYLVN